MAAFDAADDYVWQHSQTPKSWSSEGKPLNCPKAAVAPFTGWSDARFLESMCGIAGFIDFSRSRRESELTGIARMSEALRHRGPDDGGVWSDAETCVALGHRRLAILDLSPQGHQPMVSASGQYVVVFNGEIYKFQDLRHELQGEAPGSRSIFRGTSDTEVMLGAFERWGVRESLDRLNGMFAFAVLDLQDRVLHLARDRSGEKPLYYAPLANAFLFGSELKALRAHPCFRCEIDRGSLALFMRYGYIPAPYSIYVGVSFKVTTRALAHDQG